MSGEREQAVVVGATGTMGSAVVGRLLERHIPVLAVARDGTKLDALAESSELVSTCVADIGDDASMEAVGAAIAGPVRMAVFAAGLPVRGSVETLDPGGLALGADVKLGGVLRLLRAIGDRFAEAHARFVVFAGAHGIEPTAREAAPGAINAGLFNLMRQVSLIYGPRGVTSHTISAGPADTERLRWIATKVAEERGVGFETVWQEYIDNNSLGRLPTAHELAWAVTMLLDPEADVMHGGVLKLDAGGLRGIF